MSKTMPMRFVVKVSRSKPSLRVVIVCAILLLLIIVSILAGTADKGISQIGKRPSFQALWIGTLIISALYVFEVRDQLISLFRRN